MKKLLYIFIISIALVSCTEVIDIDINASNPQLVVEASIGQNEPARVVLTRSISLDELTEIPFEENADVQITDNAGNNEKLMEVSPGFYFSSLLKGEAGQTYKISIKTAYENVSAQSSIPSQVRIDTMTVVNSIYPGGGPPVGNQPAPFYEIRVKYTDPVSETNFYRFLLSVNGVLRPDNNVYNDRLTNGNEVEAFLIVYDPELKAGDSISVEMQCIEKPVYEYFSSMGSAGGPGGSSSPANPYSNLQGAILGYFSAHTVERKTYLLQ